MLAGNREECMPGLDKAMQNSQPFHELIIMQPRRLKK